MRVLLPFLAAVFIAPIHFSTKRRQERYRCIIKSLRNCEAPRPQIWRKHESISSAPAFCYVEGDYPPRFKWRSELGDGDVRELQKKGGKMMVLKPDYEAADLEDARKQCKE